MGVESAICADMGELSGQIQERWLSEDSDSMRVSGIAVPSHHTSQTKREFFFWVALKVYHVMLTRRRPLLSDLPVFVGAAVVRCVSRSTINVLLAEHFTRTRQQISRQRKRCNEAPRVAAFTHSDELILDLEFHSPVYFILWAR